MKCNNCEKEYGGGRFCPFCGHKNSPPDEVPNEAPPIVCSKCGQTLSDGPFCPFCGNNNSVRSTTDFHSRPKRGPKKPGYIFALLSAICLLVGLPFGIFQLLGFLGHFPTFANISWSILLNIVLITLLSTNKKNSLLIFTLMLRAFLLYDASWSFFSNITLTIVAIFAVFPELNARKKIIKKIWFIPPLLLAIHLLLNVINGNYDGILNLIRGIVFFFGVLFLSIWLQSNVCDSTADHSLMPPTANRCCFSCRESIGDGRFCPSCGYDNGTPPHLLGLRWYRFFVTCWLFVVAASGLSSFFSYALRLVEPSQFYYIYGYYNIHLEGRHKTMVCSYAALMLVLYLGCTVYSLVVRQRLERFKKDAPASLNTFLLASSLLSIWSFAAEYFIFRKEYGFPGIPFRLDLYDVERSKVIWALLLYFALTLIVVILNHIYFKKRSALFSQTSTKE